jgi:hypothetical protein
MSDSILYLAIVAIWAGFLIPAWVRRPHAAKAESDYDTVEFDIEIDSETDPGPVADADVAAGAGEAEHHFETEPRPASPALAPAFSPAPTADLDADVPDDVTGTKSEYRDDVHPRSDAPAELGPPAGRPVAGPSQSREQMLRARRRMLTILVGLTFATTLVAFTGLVQWWICVPPVAMLVLYVALLREIALADAELARKREAWEAARARDAAVARARAARPARHPRPGQSQPDQPDDWRREQERAEPESPERTAEIIDISGRVGDQFYDQYADAAVRAVGD